MSIFFIIGVLIASAFVSGMSYDILDEKISKKFGKKRYSDLSIPVSIFYTFVPFLLFIDYIIVMYMAGALHDIKLNKILNNNDNITITRAECKDELGLDQFGNMNPIKKCYITYNYTNTDLHRAFGNKQIVLVGEVCENFRNVNQTINTTESELRLLQLNKDMENLTTKHKSIVENMQEVTPTKALNDFSESLDFTLTREKEKIKVNK